jgi:3-isopropylmalate dehydratase small subunit
MLELAKSLPPSQLAQKAYGLYEKSRPEIPPGKKDIQPGFYGSVQPGDFIVAGKNFGCGSSREYAPRIVKDRGVPRFWPKPFPAFSTGTRSI